MCKSLTHALLCDGPASQTLENLIYRLHQTPALQMIQYIAMSNASSFMAAYLIVLYFSTQTRLFQY